MSCGTCFDQLQGYRFEEIFPGCRIVDIHEFLLEKGVRVDILEDPDAVALYAKYRSEKPDQDTEDWKGLAEIRKKSGRP